MQTWHALARYVCFALIDVPAIWCNPGLTPADHLVRTMASTSFMLLLALLPMSCVRWLLIDIGLELDDQP